MNKYGVFVFLAFFLAVNCAPFEADKLGNYKFTIDSDDQSRYEEGKADGSIKGKYTFVDPDGVKHTVEYEGGAEQGLIAKGEHLPEVVEETLENHQARNEHLAVFNAIDNDPRFKESPADESEDPISSAEYLAALKEQLAPSVPLVFQEDTPEIAAAKVELADAHSAVLA